MQDKLEIYKMASELSDRVSGRRMVANGFFLSVNTVLVSILSFSYEKLADDKRSVLIIMSLLGLILALTWFLAIRSYKRLNKAKFAVINEMEKDLPYQNFTDEWNILKRTTKADENLVGRRSGWLKFKDRYTDLTNIEAMVPGLFGLIFILIFLGAVFRVVV